MPTTKPRLSITLSPESRAALDALSEAAGVSAASFIAGLVHDAIPVIEATTRALRAARTQPQKAADILNSEVVRAVAKVAQGQLELDEAIAERRTMRRTTKRPRKP